MRKPQVPELVVYTGPMWSGKTESVEIELKQARIAGIQTIFFRPKRDTRDVRQIEATLCETIFLSDPIHVHSHLREEHQWVAFDEVHFFEEKHEEFVSMIMRLVRDGRRVLVAGLDLDFAEKPFLLTAKLMTLAQQVHKKHAICQRCKAIDEASRTQRISNETDRLVVGDKDDYEPRCLQCFVPPNGNMHSERSFSETSFAS